MQGTVRVLALAKREEEIYVPGRATPAALHAASPTLLLLRRQRDEVACGLTPQPRPAALTRMRTATRGTCTLRLLRY